MSDDNNFTLNEQQFAFINKHQIDIMIDDFGGESIVPTLISSPEYAALFGEMEWDEAYDRYSDTPGFKPLPITIDEFDTDSTIIEKLKRLRDQISKSSEKSDDSQYP